MRMDSFPPCTGKNASSLFCFVLYFFKLLIGCSLRWAHVLVYTEGLERNWLRIWRKTINYALTRKPKGMT